LQEKIIEMFYKGTATSPRKLDEWLESRNRAKSGYRSEESRRSGGEIKSASSDAEAEKQRAVAEVWRQVAEQFRQGKRGSKSELDEITRKSASDFRSVLDNLDVENLIEEAKMRRCYCKGREPHKASVAYFRKRVRTQGFSNIF